MSIYSQKLICKKFLNVNDVANFVLDYGVALVTLSTDKKHYKRKTELWSSSRESVFKKWKKFMKECSKGS